MRLPISFDAAANPRLNVRVPSLLHALYWRDTLVALLLLAFALVFYHALALQGHILMDFDSFTYFYPNETYAAESLRSGHLPLWNPYLWAGAPFLANIQTALFYPPNLLFIFFDVPRAYTIQLVLHAWLAAFSMYLLARNTLWLERPAALVAGLAYGFGGFISAQAGHLNQMQAAALLPLELLLLDLTLRRRSIFFGILTALVVALQLLAGHTQEWYLSMVVLAAYLAYLLVMLFGSALLSHFRLGPFGGADFRISEDDPGLNQILFPLYSANRSVLMRRVLRSSALLLLSFGVILVLALGLAAAQLLPTLELQGLSIRSNGLTFKEASSFSFLPSELLRGLLPLWGEEQPASNEWIGYTGIISLAMVALALAGRMRNRYTIFFTLLAAVALFLALGEWNPAYPFFYQIIPGLKLFRVPARWLLVWTLATSALAGIGAAVLVQGIAGDDRFRRLRLLQVRLIVIGVLAAGVLGFVWWTLRHTPPYGQLIIPHSPTRTVWAALGVFAAVLAGIGIAWSPNRLIPWITVIAVAIELGTAGQTLPVNRITNLPEAYSSVRSAPAFLMTQPQPFRSLSITNNTFDPGDLAELRQLLAGALTPDAIYEYIVAAKQKETLAPNVPLLYGIGSIDGYDGGVLPLRRYVELKQLLVPPAQNTPDGRLREQLTQIPALNLLALLGVDYILTDKISDPWVDGVYYDTSLTQRFDSTRPELALPNLPRFATTSIGVISYLDGMAAVPDGAIVATLAVTDISGHTTELPVRAGIETAEGVYQKGTTAHSQARVAAPWPGRPEGSNYIGVVSLPAPVYPVSITVHTDLPMNSTFYLKGLSLIDERLPASQSISIIPEMQVVHSGDVKIYKRSGSGRAFLVPTVQLVDDDIAALAAMAAPGFQPAGRAVITRQDLPVSLKADLERQHILGGESSLPPSGNVTITGYTPERVTLKVHNDLPALLVLNDTFYPGWHALVDGTDTPIVRVNYLFRGLDLPGGDHTVIFYFDSPTINLGIQITAFSLFLALLGLLYELGRWLSRRKRYKTIRIPAVRPERRE